MKPDNKEIQFGLDITKDAIYITPLKDLSVYHPSFRDSDFVGTKEECLLKINTHKDKKIYGEF